MIDVFGHLCYACLFGAMILLGQKNSWGWGLRLAGEIGWVAIGFVLGLTSVWFWGLLFCIIDANNWRKWRGMERLGSVAPRAD